MGIAAKHTSAALRQFSDSLNYEALTQFATAYG